MNQQNDTTSTQGSDPEERAFRGHSDHPPAQPDQPAQGNQELLRDEGEDEGSGAGGKSEDEHSSPGEATTLPGYGG